MNTLDRLYHNSPVWAQNIAVTAYGAYWHWLRFGGNYQAFKNAFLEREQYDPDAWQEYQREALAQLLRYVAEHIPYYQRTWNARQKQAAQAGSLMDLPLLEKEPLRADPYAFVVPGKCKQLHWKFLTSGSTGTPITSIWTLEEIRDSLALREARSAMWAGVSFTQPRATFSGRLVEPNPNSNGPYYRYNAAEKQVYFSAFHLRPETAKDYLEALHRHGVQWMTGYAVSFYLLARFILEQKLQPPPLKAIITTSEKLTSEMREIINQAYQCRVYEEYSTVENALFASECEHGKLHVSPDVSLVEILLPDGTPCTLGEAGEVVTTCLMRTYQPLIRFRLGDMAAWDIEPCGCGRAMPVIKEVLGRTEEIVVGPDGRQMVRFHGIFTGQPFIREGQIIQEALDHIHVLIVPVDGFGPDDQQNVIDRVQQRMGGTVRVSVETVSHIPRTSSGKFKAVISKIR